MPSGPKKRKAARRRNQMKKQDSSASSSPKPDPSFQESEKERSLVGIEEDEDEIFETPRSQPEMPMFVFEPNSVYFSIGSVKNGRRNKIEGLAISKGLDLEMGFEDAEPIIAVADGSVLLDGQSMERDENLETEGFNEEMRHTVSSLNENEVKFYVNSEKSADDLERGMYAKDDAGSKEVELDEFFHEIEEETSFERMEKLGTEEDHPPIEQSVLLDEEMTPNASIEVVDVSSSNEKEVKVVPWLDEELHTDNGDEDTNVDVINNEKGGDDEGNESSEREIDEVDVLEKTNLDVYGHDIEKESTLETEGELRSVEQSIPWDEEMASKASSQAVDVSTSNERVVKVMPWMYEQLLSDNGDADVNFGIVNFEKGGGDGNESLERTFNKDDLLKESKLDECVHDIVKESRMKIEEGLRLVEQSAPWDEETTHKALSGAVDVSSSNEREVKVVPWPDEESRLERMKTTKLDECIHDIDKESRLEIEEGRQSVEQSAPWDEETTHKALSGAVDVSSPNEREVKVVPWLDEESRLERIKETKLDECVHDIEKEPRLEIEDDRHSVEQFAPWDEEISHKALSGAVDVSSSNEREVIDVPWPDEELPSDNGDEDVNFDVINSEKGGDNDGNFSARKEFDKDDNGLEEVKLDECVHDIEEEEKLEAVEDQGSIENSVPLDEEISPRALIGAVDFSLVKEKEMNVGIPANSGDMNVDGNGNGNLEREFQKDEGSEESILVNSCKENKQPVPVTEKSNDLLKPIIEIMSQSDVDLTNHKSGKAVEKSSIPVENCILIVSPRALIETVDISLLKEKEMEMNAEIPAISGDVNVDDRGMGNLERELEKDRGYEESNLVNLCKGNKQPVTVTEKSKDLLEPLIEIMSQRDSDLTNNKLGKSVEKSSIPVENLVLTMEEATQGCKASHELSETLVGVNDAPFLGSVKETEEPPPNAEKTEIEVGHRPLVVRRASLWNCCGLLEVLTSPDR